MDLQNEINCLNLDLAFYIETDDIDGAHEVIGRGERLMRQIDTYFPCEGDDLRDEVAGIMDSACDFIEP